MGRARGPLRDAAEEYERRLARVLRVEVVEVREEPLQRGTGAEVRAREAARLAPHVEGWPVVCLDRGGRALDSPGLARLLAERLERPPQRTAFVVGGPTGLDPAFLGRAVAVLSLGPMTLPHQLARVVLAEQLYRATTIMRGEPYHR